MDISFDSQKNLLFPLNTENECNNSFIMEDENISYYHRINDFLFNNNEYDCDIPFCFGNENSFDYNQRRGNLFLDDISNTQNSEQIYYFPLFTNNSISPNTIKEKNLTNLDDDMSNTKLIFDIKKEIPTKILYEKAINVIIRLYNISKQMKLKLLLDINTKNNEIKQIKNVLTSNNIKRRKRTKKNILYRSDHILSKLVNIINLSLYKFINKLIIALITNEKLNQILTGLNLLKKTTNKDLKEVIKKNGYVFRYKLTKNDEKLNLLNLTLKKYFSVKISSKYNKLKYPSNYNELIIEKLLKDENNKDIFDFILNDLLIKDWLEIFLYKKDLKDFDKYNIFNKVQRNKIKENLERIDKYINKIYKNNKIYFHCFVLIAYNLNKYLQNKETRNRNEKQEKKEK